MQSASGASLDQALSPAATPGQRRSGSCRTSLTSSINDNIQVPRAGIPCCCASTMPPRARGGGLVADGPALRQQNHFQSTLIRDCGLIVKQAKQGFLAYLIALAKRPHPCETDVLAALIARAGNVGFVRHSAQAVAVASARGECLRAPALVYDVTEHVTWAQVVTCMVSIATSSRRTLHRVRELAVAVLAAAAMSCARCTVPVVVQLQTLLDGQVGRLALFAAVHWRKLPAQWLHHFAQLAAAAAYAGSETLQNCPSVINVLLDAMELRGMDVWTLGGLGYLLGPYVTRRCCCCSAYRMTAKFQQRSQRSQRSTKR